MTNNDGPIYSVFTGKGCDQNSFPCRIRQATDAAMLGGSNCAEAGVPCCISYVLEYLLYWGEDQSGNTRYKLWSDPSALYPSQNGIVTTDVGLATQNATTYCNTCVNMEPGSSVQC